MGHVIDPVFAGGFCGETGLGPYPVIFCLDIFIFGHLSGIDGLEKEKAESVCKVVFYLYGHCTRIFTLSFVCGEGALIFRPGNDPVFPRKYIFFQNEKRTGFDE